MLREALKTRARYIGMIGSKKKVHSVLENLAKEGFSGERLKSVHAPIGVSIATDTPEEIAVSIVAEIVDVRRSDKKAKATSLR